MTERLTSIKRSRPPRLKLNGRRAVTIVALTLAWCGLWQAISVANVVSGIAVSAVVLSTGIGTSGDGAVRFVPLLRLIWTVLVDLVTSTAEVAKEILTPANNTSEAIVAVEIPRDAKRHFLLLIVAITLTPGTAVVDADPDTGTLYLHLLHNERADEVKQHVAVLAELANQALPSTTSIERRVRSQP